MPPPKSLVDHVRDDSFIPGRHAELLEFDDSLDRLRFEDDDPYLYYWAKLSQLQAWYRYIATTDNQRREGALAFRDAIRRDYRRYDLIIGDRMLTWRRGKWELVPASAKAIREDKARARRIDRTFLTELWTGLGDLDARDAPFEEHVACVRKMARKYDVPDDVALQHVANVLKAPPVEGDAA